MMMCYDVLLFWALTVTAPFGISDGCLATLERRPLSHYMLLVAFAEVALGHVTLFLSSCCSCLFCDGMEWRRNSRSRQGDADTLATRC